MKKVFMLVLLVFWIRLGSPDVPVDLYDNWTPAESFSQEAFYSMLQKTVEHPDVVFAQAILESGHFTSTLWDSLNNPFGMMHPASRPTTSTGPSLSGFATYPSWQDAVIDQKLFQEFLKEKRGINQIEDYYGFLKRVGYATDPKYIQKVKRVASKQDQITGAYD